MKIHRLRERCIFGWVRFDSIRVNCGIFILGEKLLFGCHASVVVLLILTSDAIPSTNKSSN